MAKIRVGGEINWWKSCSFCLLRFSKHKSISTAVLFCIIVGGGYSRKVFRLRSFFISSRKAWKKMEFAVGFSSVNIVGFHRDVLLFLKLYTLVEEPSLDQISQALQATVFCNEEKIRHIYQVFTLVKNSEINWWDCQLWKYRKKELKTSL